MCICGKSCVLSVALLAAVTGSAVMTARGDDTPKTDAPKQATPPASKAGGAVVKRFEIKKEWTYAEDDSSFATLRKTWGRQAPALKIGKWEGEAQSLDKLKGKIVVIDFWATWCGPCKAAIPHTNEIAKKYADKGVKVFGVCNTRGSETMSAVAKQKSMEYPTGADNADASAKAYGVSWWPFYCVIDRDGVLRATGIDPKSLETVLDGLLAEQAAADANAKH